jgi:DNA-binding NarL/FixJ family response regulator
MNLFNPSSMVRSGHSPVETPTARVQSFPIVSSAPALAVRIAIIEPNWAKAELLAYFCTKNWGFDVISVEKMGERGIAAVGCLKPELILATIAQDSFATKEFVVRLRDAAPAAKLVLFSTQCNEYLLHALSSVEYHALIYEPDESLASIGCAIERVRDGSRFISTRMAECQAALRTNSTAFPKLLTKREQEVLTCIACSLSDEEISMRLECRAGTVLAHRRELMRKLDIHTTPKLIRYCIDKGFISGSVVVSPSPTRWGGA